MLAKSIFPGAAMVIFYFTKLKTKS